MFKDVDDCPAYLTTMLVHQGSEVGLHQKIAKALGEAISEGGPPWPLNAGKPPLSNEKILEALEKTYAHPDVGLTGFWEVCNAWRNAE